MHDSTTIKEALGRVFDETLFEWTPYLAQYYLERPDLVAEEEDLIRKGEMNPMGYRYVGRKAATSR
jgi:hypothetical protein